MKNMNKDYFMKNINKEIVFLSILLVVLIFVSIFVVQQEKELEIVGQESGEKASVEEEIIYVSDQNRKESIEINQEENIEINQENNPSNNGDVKEKNTLFDNCINKIEEDLELCLEEGGDPFVCKSELEDATEKCL